MRFQPQPNEVKATVILGEVLEVRLGKELSTLILKDPDGDVHEIPIPTRHVIDYREDFVNASVIIASRFALFLDEYGLSDCISLIHFITGPAAGRTLGHWFGPGDPPPARQFGFIEKTMKATTI